MSVRLPAEGQSAGARLAWTSSGFAVAAAEAAAAAAAEGEAGKPEGSNQPKKHEWESNKLNTKESHHFILYTVYSGNIIQKIR